MNITEGFPFYLKSDILFHCKIVKFNGEYFYKFKGGAMHHPFKDHDSLKEESKKMLESGKCYIFHVKDNKFVKLLYCTTTKTLLDNMI